ncbi:MAG: hypothetical protein E7319_07560 [Clostridiales bacterium]|nr:hypothetical protein [Clostridiales bacterium]
MKTNRLLAGLLLILLMFSIHPVAYAQDVAQPGPLTLEEFEQWLRTLEQHCAAQAPLNDPVGEESLTEDGYAFLYDVATLYYTMPDSSSALRGVSLTEESFSGPRGIAIGSDQSLLMEAYGWQNPMLLGDGTFAALYAMDEMPATALWSWALHDGGQLMSVQCALHIAMGDGMYTDMGLQYQLQEGVVTSIRVYGLGDALVGEADVYANLSAVESVGMTGDLLPAAAGRLMVSAAEPFGAADLQFGSIDFVTLDETKATSLFGRPVSQSSIPYGEDAVYLSVERDGLSIDYLQSADGQQMIPQTILITSFALEGPRGIRIGMSLEDVIACFRCDGSGAVLGSANLLYGDGMGAPYGLEEPDGMGGIVLRYLAEAESERGLMTVTLQLSFVEGQLTEMMMYAW